MVQLIAAETRKARFDRHDDSAEFIQEAMEYIRAGYFPGDRIGRIRKIKFHELRAIAQLKANNWVIKKGQHYIKQYNKMEGQLYNFCTLPAILRFCTKYKLYGDD